MSIKNIFKGLFTLKDSRIDPDKRLWTRRTIDVWYSDDNAVVKTDPLNAAGSFLHGESDSRFGWYAWGPGKDDNPITTVDPVSGRVKMVKFSDPYRAMTAVDKRWPDKV